MAPVAPGSSLLLLVQANRTSEGRPVVDRRASFGRRSNNDEVDRSLDLQSVWQVAPPPWAVGEVECDAKAGYLDRKWALRGEATSGWLSLKFEVKLKICILSSCPFSIFSYSIFRFCFNKTPFQMRKAAQ